MSGELNFRGLNPRLCIRKAYPIVGDTLVCMKRDENMGKCLICSCNFITPNMPKLQYALDFEVVDENLILKDRLNPTIEKFSEAHVFEKRDGFNCLFYLFKGKVIPKTRLAPIASGKIQQVIKLPGFPMKEIERMVRDCFVPVFEVWGTKLDEFGIMHGSVDLAKVQEREGLPELNVDLIGVMKADYESCEYEWLPPEEIIKKAEEYGLNHVKYHGTINLSVDSIKRLMDKIEDENREGIVREGVVLHCYNREYKMYKVKPYTLMQKDVVTASTIPRKRILLEISKVLVETDVLEVARNPVEYIRMVLDYLSEDYKITNKIAKKVNRVFVEAIAEAFVQKYPEYSSEPWKLGVHKMFIGKIKSI